jgi:hypothetical protein
MPLKANEIAAEQAFWRSVPLVTMEQMPGNLYFICTCILPDVRLNGRWLNAYP